ncbi:DUF5130 family protein [Pseudofrankia inefficax]|uniref:TLP18.3, Psb32 and MOLO-1 founding protein of phosphatase n=1 Tax=Pseudofrankia inefficax (strain DSM 45817 / CECT 9037 / DDB 130130 / EuI1c) TaxID=298654 RepID=E3J5N1_PSEI1|nr:hypothetical protein FraEuI1c_5129 [Pseudofrankia inefficax]
MASGEAFRQDQLDRLNRARLLAERQTGIAFHVRVGAVSGEPEAAADRLLTEIVGGRLAGDHVLVVVSPGQRFVRVVTTPTARRRISDAAASLATLSMTSSFAVGDLVGGLVSGLRQLADAAGRPGRPPGQPVPSGDPASPASAPTGSGPAAPQGSTSPAAATARLGRRAPISAV